MENQPRRVTQNDVAKAAGVNRATVSLALRKQPGIPEKTRLRIEQVAKRLGYVPDPMLTALASYRGSQRRESFHGTLAWFAETSVDFRWRSIPHFITYLESARRAAKKHGYQLEVFDVDDMKVSWARAAGIAQARGVRGILLCPQPHAHTMLEQFPWDRFSAVTFGYSLVNPALNSIVFAHYSAVLRIVQELRARGYRRIGYALREDHDIRLNRTLTAGYLISGQIYPEITLLKPCPDDGHFKDGNGRKLRRWLEQNKPEALILGTPIALALLDKWGIRPPTDMGIACSALPQSRTLPGGVDGEKTASTERTLIAPLSHVAGIVEDDERIGEAAVDLLVSMMHRGERGIPLKPQKILIEGMWNEGTTLRPVAAPGLSIETGITAP